MKKLILIFLISLSYSELISPDNGTTLNHIHILFEWDQIPEALNYTLQISEDINFSSILVEHIDQSTAHIDKQNLDWDNSYYWRVRGNLNNVSLDWSSAFTFSTSQSLSSSSISFINDSQYQDGVTIFGAFFNYFSAAIDKNGKEIWNSSDNNFVYYSSNNFGNIFGCNLLSGAENNLPGMEINFQNNIIWEEPNDEFLHHDIIKLPNGNYLGIVEASTLGPIPIGTWTPSFQSLGFQANGTAIEFPWVGDKLVEWDKDTKEVVWSWSVFDHFNMNDYDQIGGTWIEAYLSLHYDWTHVNAVVFDEINNALYISSRHLSRITKIAYPSGEIIWNLGHQMPSGEVNLGTDIGFSFQHSIQILSNGNLLTFDNGNLSPEFRGTDEPISRAIEIEIEDGVANLIWAYDLPPDLFGFASGNAQKLDNGNVLITTVGGGGRSIEVNQESEIVWEGLYNLSLPDGAVYRAHRVPGLFPAAFSTLIHNYVSNTNDTGVYLPIGSSDITFSITNEGEYLLPLTIDIIDEENWFGEQSIELTLEKESTETVSLFGEVNSLQSANHIQITITPKYHSDKAKTTLIYGYTYPLNNDNEKNIISNEFYLEEPYPNPFNSNIFIKYSIDKEQLVSLQVFNLKGQLIQTLVRKNLTKGEYTNIWDATDHPSGAYIIKLSSPTMVKSHKILYLK